jgi:YjbE family integral membrane protein
MYQYMGSFGSSLYFVHLFRVCMELLLGFNWLVVGQIIVIDILLGGDNAILIALACRNLPEELRLKGILWGTCGAVVIRIVLIAFAVGLMQVPYLKMIGGLLLFWIGIRLLADSNIHKHENIHASNRLLVAVRTIVLADVVMSLDNVIAIASAAEQVKGEHQLFMVIFGIVVSIPVIIWGSTLVLRLMVRFPIIIVLGAALLGYLAAGMVVTDIALAHWLEASSLPLHIKIPELPMWINMPGLIGALIVVGLGRFKKKRAATINA